MILRAIELKSALEVARIEFQDESNCFRQDDNTPATKHDLYVLACSINQVLGKFESLISSAFMEQ